MAQADKRTAVDLLFAQLTTLPERHSSSSERSQVPGVLDGLHHGGTSRDHKQTIGTVYNPALLLEMLVCH